MAAILNAAGLTIVGTPDQIEQMLRVLLRLGAGVINAEGMNLVPLEQPLDNERLSRALEAVPRHRLVAVK